MRSVTGSVLSTEAQAAQDRRSDRPRCLDAVVATDQALEHERAVRLGRRRRVGGFASIATVASGDRRIVLVDHLTLEAQRALRIVVAARRAARAQPRPALPVRVPAASAPVASGLSTRRSRPGCALPLPTAREPRADDEHGGDDERDHDLHSGLHDQPSNDWAPPSSARPIGSGARSPAHARRSPRCSVSSVARIRSSASFSRERTVAAGMPCARAISAALMP